LGSRVNLEKECFDSMLLLLVFQVSGIDFARS
jgi:hypothetical protein